MHKRIRATSVFTAVVVLIFSILFLVPIQTVQAQDFSIDQTSPEVPAPWSAADGIFWFGLTSPTVFSSGGIGLTPSDNVNAFSYGLDYFAAANQNSRIEFRFSVDRPTVGMPASIVNAQVTGNGAAGDKYGFVADGLGAVVTSTFLSSDAPSHSLTTLPGQSEIDGLSMSGVPAPEPIFPSPVYFSIDIATAASAAAVWGFTASTADIYYVPGPVGAGPVIPTLYAPKAFLGLMAGDVIDAVALQDLGQRGLYDGSDQVLLSLAPGSPTLAAMGASPADILLATPGPSLVIHVPASSLGLMSTDNLDAITTLDPSVPPVECEANGDVNADGNFNVADITYLISYLDRAGEAPIPPYSADVNSDCIIDTFDIIALTEALAGQLALPVPTCCAVSTEFFECCVGVRGNVDGDANDIVDIADLILLIDHLYINNPPVDCHEEANLNGDTLGINMADLVFMTDHLFRNFTPMPLCDSSISSISVDVFNPDTLRLVVTDTQFVDGDLNFSVELWMYNDAQTVLGIEAGFGWNSPNIQMVSANSTPLIGNLFVNSFLSFDNSTRQFQFAGFTFAVPGLVQFPTAQHIATYQMTYSNWTPDDVISFDTVRFRNTGYGLVGADNRMWFPEFVSQGIAGAGCCVGTTGNVDGDPNDIVDIADLTFLIDHLYVDNPPVSCPEEANINADSLGINMADLVMFIDHLFINFFPLPGCGSSGSVIGIDNGNADTVRLVVADTQMVGGDLQFEVELWFYNDANDVVGAEAGFSWNSPNLQMDSSTIISEGSSFDFLNQASFDNSIRGFNFAGARIIGPGLVQSGVAKHMATYWMTYSNWTPADAISFDTARFRNTGYDFVNPNMQMWFPEFVSQGIAGAGCCVGSRGNVDGDPGDIVDIADFTFLIDHLYINNPPVGCPEEANVNGDTFGINMADLVFLNDHNFGNFPDLAMCGASLPSVGIDSNNVDTVRLVVANTQLVGSDLKIEVELWYYNDGQAVVGAEAGFRWNSPNLQMDSSTATPLAESSFGFLRFLTADNATQQFQFVGFRIGGQGLLPSATAQHIATYWMTYSNWTPADAISFDTAHFRNTGYDFVGADNRMWFPEFVSLGTDFGFTGIGAATVDNTDGVITVSNIGSSGDDGVSITVPGSEPFVGMEIGNIDLAVPDITLTLNVNGEFSSPVGLARGNLPPQLVGAIGIATAGGAIQLSADFSSLGDPNVQFEVYNGPLLTGGASVPGGGVVAIGGDAGFGMPVVTSLTYSGVSPPSFTINLDRATRFTLTNGTILIGDKIRLIGVNATGSVDLVSTINVNASGIGFFTLTGVTTSSTGFCCLGFTGNINCDTSDLIDIADLTELIDHLFINFPPLCCPKEGNIDGDINGTVDIADLTALIDFLFINFTVTSPCQ